MRPPLNLAHKTLHYSASFCHIFLTRLFNLSLPVFPQHQLLYTRLRTLTSPDTHAFARADLSLYLLGPSLPFILKYSLIRSALEVFLHPVSQPRERTSPPPFLSQRTTQLQTALATWYLKVCVSCLRDQCVGHRAHGVSLSPELSIHVWPTLQRGSGKGSTEEQNGRGPEELSGEWNTAPPWWSRAQGSSSVLVDYWLGNQRIWRPVI